MNDILSSAAALQRELRNLGGPTDVITDGETITIRLTPDQAETLADLIANGWAQ